MLDHRIVMEVFYLILDLVSPSPPLSYLDKRMWEGREPGGKVDLASYDT